MTTIHLHKIFLFFIVERGLLCGLVVRVSGYRSRGPPSLVSTIEELLERKSNGSGLENGDYGHRGSAALLRDTPLSTKVGTNFIDKWRLLGRYSLLAY
jgi:hypothetical protein